MDLGCIDMGCVEKLRKENSLEKDSSPKESLNSASKFGKNTRTKDSVRSSLSTLNKLASQITKPPHRKTSPLNWFPRKKVEPYLKRKIKLLQEVDGMHSTLDETLGDSNPHYSRVLREKIAIKEAAEKAMQARKAAMVEASWCRILQAARIESREAEDQLARAEKSADEAFEVARAIGVIMNDIPDCAHKRYKIETTSAKGGGSNTHTVSATFETAFEVDKQVAAAVKAALIKLANCPSIKKDEFKELLRKISENPDMDESSRDLSEFSSECESDAGSELEVGSCKDGWNYQEASCCNKEFSDARQRKHRKRRESDTFKLNNVVELMLDRLRCLKEEELASLATIVGTCGLNAALAKAESDKQYALSSASENMKNPCLKASSRQSLGGRTARNSITDAPERTADTELPSLDKYLVKRLTRLEREVLEAKSAPKNQAEDEKQKLDKHIDGKLSSVDSSRSQEKLKEDTTVSDFGSILVKHSSKLEKEVEEARTKNCNSSVMNNKESQMSRTVAVGRARQEAVEVPSLDKFLVKRLTRLEREVQESRSRKNIEPTEGGNITDASKTTTFLTDARKSEDSTDGDSLGKENMDLNKIRHRNVGKNLPYEANYESLDSVLVKHVSRLEKEKMGFCPDEKIGPNSKRMNANRELENSEGSLDQVLVKHKSRLEREKMAASDQQYDIIKHSVSRRQAREKELQAAWGGLSLGNSIRPHVSKLERDKATWLKAEEEERKRAMEEV